MRKFRMLTATALIGAMVFGVTACGQPIPTTVTTEPTTTVTETETTPSESETTPSETSEATKETTVEATACPFANDDFAGVSAESGMSGFDWKDASLEVAEDNGMSFPKKPNYKAGQDIVFTFASTATITLDSVARITSDTMNAGINEMAVWASCQAGGTAMEGVTNIKDGCTLINADGVYTLTIPANAVETGNYYFIALQNTDTAYTTYIYVRCEA